MKITSWNVNSVRARIVNIKEYIKKFKPDILIIQEIKTEEKNFPFNDIKDIGYDSYVCGQKAYNGVAILAKIKISKIEKDFIKDKKKQARAITCEIMNRSDKIELINVYVPNGNPINTDKYSYKKEWFDSLLKVVQKKIKKNKNIIIGGDFNVIPDEIDAYDYTKYENDALFVTEIRKKYRELLNLGFVDIYRHINKNNQEFTFWDYMSGAWQKNNGLRIDHFLVSINLVNKISNININKQPRGKIKPSDHTPIELEIN